MMENNNQLRVPTYGVYYIVIMLLNNGNDGRNSGRMVKCWSKRPTDIIIYERLRTKTERNE